MTSYYQNNYQTYYEKTVAVNSASFLEPFARELAAGSVVWDVGCGSGRDLLWLKERGMKPVGFEYSSGLAQLARSYSGCRVIQGDFETYDFSTAGADGMLLTGALVHLEPDAVGRVLGNILSGLNRGGLLYISMKQGKGSVEDETGRRFYLWQPDCLESVFRKLDLEILDRFTTTSALDTKEPWLAYLLRLP